MIVFGTVLALMCIFINPLYILIIGSFIEMYKKLPSYLNYVLAFSIAIAIANREIGVQWSSVDGFGNDDAINYLNFYFQTQFSSYIVNFIEIIPNIFKGKEPLWFILAEISGRVSSYNGSFLIFISIFVPILLLHFSFQKITKYFCFSALVFYFLVPEVFHMLFHLFRTSIGLSIVILCFAGLLAANKSRSKLIYLAPFGHLAMILPASVLFFGRFISFDLSILNKIISIIILSILFFIGIYVLLYIASIIGFEKIVFHLTFEAEMFKLHTRHLVYLILAIYLIFVTKNKNIFIVSLAAFLLILLPFSFNSIGIIYERILIIFTPLLALSLVYESSASKFKRFCIISILTINFLYLITKISDKLFWQYMADGQFFNFFSGLFYHFYKFLM
jgi:hypothetical protein